MELTRSELAKVRKLMWHWGNALDYIKRRENDIAHLRAIIDDAYETLHAQNLDGMPHAKGSVSSSVERAIERMEQRIETFESLEKSIQADILTTTNLKIAIDEQIRRVNDVERRVLTYRFCDGLQWSFISVKMNYDESRVQAIEKSALEKIARHISFHTIIQT